MQAGLVGKTISLYSPAHERLLRVTDDGSGDVLERFEVHNVGSGDVALYNPDTERWLRVMGGDDQVVDAHCKSTTFDPNWRHERLRIHDAGDGHVGLYCPKSDRWVATTPKGEAKTFQAGETYLKSWEWERFLVNRALCSVCNKVYALTKSGRIRSHKLADGSKCTGSGKQPGGDKRPRGSNSSRNSAEPQKKAGRAA